MPAPPFLSININRRLSAQPLLTRSYDTRQRKKNEVNQKWSRKRGKKGENQTTLGDRSSKFLKKKKKSIDELSNRANHRGSGFSRTRPAFENVISFVKEPDRRWRLNTVSCLRFWRGSPQISDILVFLLLFASKILSQSFISVALHFHSHLSFS